MCGREAELAVLDAALDAARAGACSALVFTGPPGSGKSALLRHLVDVSNGCCALRIAGVASESGLPFAGLHRLLGRELDRLPRLPVSQRRALSTALGGEDGTPASPFLVGAAVLSLVSDIAADSPVLVCVDDLHLLDEPTVNALFFAARRLRTANGGIALLATSVGDSTVVPDDVQARELADLPSEACAVVLAEHGVPDVPPHVAAVLARSTGGNPRALGELAALLDNHQLTGRAPLPDPLPAGAWTQSNYGMRASGPVPDDAAQVMLIAAAEGSGDPALLAMATREAGLGEQALDAAEATGLIRIERSEVRFRHPLVRSAIYSQAPAARRRAAHRTIAAALDGTDRVEHKAWHRGASVLVLDDGVAGELDSAAAVARARGGHGAAVRVLERAAVLSGDPRSRALRFVAAAADACAAGRHEPALSLLDRADRCQPDAETSGLILRLRGELELRDGVVADAYAALVAAAERLAPASPATAIEALAAAGDAAVYAGDVDKLIRVGERAQALVHAGSDVEHRVLSDVLRGGGEVLSGATAAGTRRLRAAFAHAGELHQPRTLARLAMAAALAGDDAESRTLGHRALDGARADGALAVVPHALEYVVGAEMFRGAFQAAEAHAMEGIALARDAGQANSGAYLRADLALVAAFRGDEQACRHHAGLALHASTANGLGLPAGIANWALGLIDLGVGRPAGAAQRLSALRGAGPGAGHPIVKLLSIPHQVEALVRQDPPDLNAARPAAAGFRGWCEQVEQPWALALSARCQALLGDPDTDDHFRAALRWHRHTGRPFDRARTELLYGEYLRRKRSRTQARAHLHSAWETFDRLGSGLWERRARAELRAAGGAAEISKPSVEDTPLTALVDNLTSQELRIARLVGHGATNREVAAQLFISPRTVDYHLRKVFHRLGITSRVELALLDELR
ncbi:MAG: AAA family ATPase [Thermocrispum sp.]